MKKTLLEVEFDTDYYIIGISCHLKDYRVGYWVNKELGLQLAKKSNYHPTESSSNEASGFSIFVQEDHKKETYYYLVANRGSEGLLLPEYKQCDYLFVIENPIAYDTIYLDALEKIKSIGSILTAFEIEYDSLKNKERLIFQ